MKETMNQDWDGQLTVEGSECSWFKGSELYQDFEMLDKQKLGTENKTWLKNNKEEKKLYGFFKCFGQIQVDAASLVQWYQTRAVQHLALLFSLNWRGLTLPTTENIYLYILFFFSPWDKAKWLFNSLTPIVKQ